MARKPQIRPRVNGGRSRREILADFGKTPREIEAYFDCAKCEAPAGTRCYQPIGRAYFDTHIVRQQEAINFLQFWADAGLRKELGEDG